MRRPRRRKGLSEKDKKGLAILGLAGVMAVVLVVIPLFVADDGAYDPATLCPTDRPFPRTIVIVDKTDPFTEAQSRFLRAEIERLRNGMVQYEKLAIYVLDQRNFSAPVAVFELCNPGTGAEANALYQNPRKIRLRFENRFGRPLDALLTDLTKGARADHSPIMEMIRNVGYGGDFKDRGEMRRLIILSDMIQHMPGFSQYRAPMEFNKFAKTQYFERIRASLPGVRVQLIYLIRRGRERIQSKHHIEFWEKFFTKVGARIQSVRYGP